MSGHRRVSEAGKVRRSSLISTFGPGAVVDMRSRKGAPLSGVVAGLEEWDRHAPPGLGGLRHPQRIREPRLERALHVRGFRSPPVPPDDESAYDVVPLVRFPTWLQCPHCNLLSRKWKVAYPGEPDRICVACSEDRGADVFVVPVRFIAACKAGHIEEFPWRWWISCRCSEPRLRLTMEAAGLAGKILECLNKDCVGRRRSLEGILGRAALGQLKCSGEHPWFGGERDANCPHPVRALQRGAGNVYWGRLVSAISIPPYSDDPSKVFGNLWPSYEDLPEEDWESQLDLHLKSKKLSAPRALLLEALRNWHGSGVDDQDDLLSPEYRQFVRGCEEAVREGEFEVLPQRVPEELQSAVAGLGIVQRLREVQALVSFTRINPPTGPFRDATQKDARLSGRALDWLPAAELLGEGIFFTLNEKELSTWESSPLVKSRFNDRVTALKRDLREDEVILEMLSPRFLLIHSLAHALMTQLSLSCGYGSSSLRERIYSTVGASDMAGLLILTSTPDSDGTLGGLAREGRTDRFVDSFLGAIRAQRWCASDPLCITGAAALSSPRNGAACHACLLVPETSCAHFNMYLDRAFLVGTPEQPEIGFFSRLLAEFGSP